MDDQFQPPRNFILVAVALEGSLALLALGLGWLLGVPVAETVRWNWSALGQGAVATCPLLALAWLCLKWRLPALRRLMDVVDELLVPLFQHCRIWELAAVSAVAGLGEEMLFRAVLQEAVTAWVGGAAGTWVGLAVASLLFGLMHPFTKTYALLAGLIGLFLGWLWIATGNLLVPVTAHALYDFLALVYLTRTRGQKPTLPA